ncbi:MAG: hypothetical protein ACOCWK_09520 [Tangfeifania sp.]
MKCMRGGLSFFKNCRILPVGG